MTFIDIHEAKLHLLHLVDQVAEGESFVIIKAGKPAAKITALDVQPGVRRLGFMLGQIKVPDDFDRMAVELMSGR